MASLAGLETALENKDSVAIQQSIDLILLLHGMVTSFGGIPLLYYGDEIATQNDYAYLKDASKAHDNRWIHRPQINWKRAELRHQNGSPEQKIFDGLKKMIAIRKTIPAFADYNNRQLIETDNQQLFVFLRNNPFQINDNILVVGNFSYLPQFFSLSVLGNKRFKHQSWQDLYSGTTLTIHEGKLLIPPYCFYWLRNEIL